MNETFDTLAPQKGDSEKQTLQKLLFSLVSGGLAGSGNGVAVRQSLVCGGVGYFAQARGTNKAYTHRARLRVNADTTNLRVWFHGFKEGTYPTSQVAFDNSYTVKAAFELADSSGTPTGEIVPITFSGARTKTIEPSTVVQSDPCGLALNAGDYIFIRVLTDASGTYVPVNRRLAGTVLSNGEGITSGDVVDSGAITSFSWSQSLAPVAVTGDTVAQHGVVILGTSIDAYSHDWAYSGPVQGYLSRALQNVRGYANLALGGESLTELLTNVRLFSRLPFCRYARTAIVNHGTNDMGLGSRTAAQVQEDVTTVSLLLRKAGIERIVGCKILPRTTSTDGWETTTNQTLPAWEAERLAFNTWLDTTTVVDGVIDVLSTVEATGGKWKANAATLTKTAGTGSTTTSVVDGTGGWTTNQFAGKVCKFGSSYVGIIANTATTLTLVSALSGAPTVGQTYYILDTYTSDGTHPMTIAHEAMAAAVSTTYL